ncbi:MAG TPA: DMT family transporter [Candidatus Thermoplasmatota archaeon]|nr:DMT family transporter [Candidatus Thermoplasmatota archaeon]
MPDAKPAFPPGLGVAIVVVSVSFAAPLFRLTDAPPVTASFWRLAFAVLLLLPFSFGALQAWRAYRAPEWRITTAAGLALAAHFALWVTSLFMTSVAAATCLVTLQCVFVALGGHFLLGDRLGRMGWTGVAAASLGGIVIALGDGALAPDSATAIWGDVLATVAGLGSAAYMLIGRRLRRDRGLVEYVLPVYAIAAVGLAVAALVLRQPLLSFTQSTSPANGAAAWLATHFGAWAPFVVFVLLAAVPMLGGHTVSNWVLKHLPAHTVATWILLEPVGAALLAWPVLGEVPLATTWMGGALVLLGAFLTIPRRGATAATEPAG